MKSSLEVRDETPLKWPEGWGRTLLDNRRSNSSWKKSFSTYRDSLIKELERMGVRSATISHNDSTVAIKDPGVAVWFSLRPVEDFSWQRGLQIDEPAPSLDQIDSAYRRLAQKHHPDAVANGSGGDVLIFHKLGEYRKKARAWVLGSNAPQHDNCIPMDLFVDARQNLAAIRAFVAHLRGLERLGGPAVVERVVSSSFKAQLPQHATEGVHV